MLRDLDEVRVSLAQITELDVSEAESRLQQLGEQGTLISLLKTIIADAPLLSAAAARSYVHSNGFDKIPLITSSQPEYKLVLHVWQGREKQQDAPIEDIHNHRWDFTSLILTGGLVWEQYERSLSDALLCAEYQYASPSNGFEYSLRPIGQTSLECSFRAWLPAGTAYALSHRVLHRVRSAPSGMTATIILQGRTVQETTTVCRSNQSTDTGKVLDVRLTRLNESDVIARITSVLTAIADRWMDAAIAKMHPAYTDAARQ